MTRREAQVLDVIRGGRRYADDGKRPFFPEHPRSSPESFTSTTQVKGWL